MRVRMTPHLDEVKTGVSGIHTIVRKYFEHLPKYGIELVDRNQDSFDILAVHAGMGSKYPNDVSIIAHCHGLYFTSEYSALSWEWAANESVIESLRRADVITVPSDWVNETIKRDMRINASVVPHGIDWDEWQHTNENGGYILAYAKNRVMDVCNPAFISELAKRFPDKLFICTFAPKDAPGNVRITGLLKPDKMKEVIQKAAMVISPIRETFGILTLESMASGTPVLGYNYGGNKDLIQHGINGYLAQPGNVDDLADGLIYCLKYRDTLSENARITSKEYTWDKACKILADVYNHAMKVHGNSISVIIPSYNYAHKLGEAIESVTNSTVLPCEIIIVDDGSTDNTEEVVKRYSGRHIYMDIKYHKQNNSGVAIARNTGISMAQGDYIVCLDADDRIDTEFLRACQDGLDKDPTLGIAYTGLLAVEPDGNRTDSSWPPQYNFNDMVYEGGINQIPTACMFRKSMWERLGGYRSRYCPNGAGSEDAEFWLRAGLYGFKGRKVTDAPLFIYSYKSGQVSGDKTYREINWRELHPSTKDKLHPFPCVATPKDNRPSHPVRQYDEPLISIIIPIGSGHKQHVFNALDSLESQTLRKWEVILVDDAPDETEWSFDGVPDMLKSYPYVRLIHTDHKGTGYARNRGAEISRASLIIFLDADDNFLVPNALEDMLNTWNDTGMAVYTDYVSKAIITPEEAERLKNNKRLLSYNPKDNLAMHLSFAGDYDCEKAINQPANPLFIWNLITTLIPKKWHDEIGGFDENMPSWEDWEYWLRMARSGKCFVRIAEPMIAYRFYTGGRRETGIQMPQELLSYISKKLEGVDIMPCRSCGGSKNVTRVQVVRTQVNNEIVDNDMVLISYENPNRGMHKVVGASSHINYGPRQGGGVEKFYVHKADIAAYPDWFVPFNPPSVVVDKTPTELPPPPLVIIEDEAEYIPNGLYEAIDSVVHTLPASGTVVEMKPLDKPFDLQSIPGVTERIAIELNGQGIKTWQDIIDFGLEGLKSIEGIGEKRAEAILNSARKNVE